MDKKKVYGFGNVFEDTKKKKEVDRRAAAAKRAEPARKENAARATSDISSKSVPVQQRDIVMQAAKEAVEKQKAAERTAKLQKADLGLFSPQVMAKARAIQAAELERSRMIEKRDRAVRDNNRFLSTGGNVRSLDTDYQAIINQARREGNKQKEEDAKEARFAKIFGNIDSFGQYANRGDYTPNVLNEAALQLYENRKNQRVAELAQNYSLKELQAMQKSAMVNQPLWGMNTGDLSFSDRAESRRQAEYIQEARKLKTNLYDESLRLGFEDLKNAPDFNEKSIPNTDKSLNNINMYIYADQLTREKMRQEYFYPNEGNIFDRTKYKYVTMRSDERKLYSYIANTQGEKAAREYLKSLDRTLNARLAVREKQNDEARAKEAPVRSSIASALAAPGAGITGSVQMAKDAIKEAATGRLETADINAIGYRGVRSRENVRSKVSQNMTGTQKFFYDVGMSMGDMLAAMPFGPTGAAAIMGSGAAAATAYEAGKRGLSATEAAKLGIASGVIETVTEKIGLDRLTDIMKLSKGGIKGALKGMVKQGIPEGFEEITSGFLNHLAEQVILGEKSQYNENVRNYIAGGMSEEEAKKQAIGGLITEFALSGLGGLLSGAAFGGPAGGLGMLVDTGDTKIGASHTAVKNNNAIRENGLTPIDDMITQKETYAKTENKEGTASSFLTAPQLSVDTVNEAIPSEDRIPQKETDVKRGNEEGTTEAENIAAEIGIDKSVPNRQETKKRTGVRATVAAERMRRARPKYFVVLNGISKKLNIETVIDEDIEGADGYYDKTTGELHINLNAQNPLKVIVKHELTHVLEDNNKAYDDMVSFVKTELKDEWNSKYSEIQSRYERINKRRAEKGLEIVEFDEYEVMAELAEQFDTDKFIEKVSGVNRPMAERIRDFISEVIKKIKSAFGNTKELSKWEQAEAKWNKALEAATKTDRSGEGRAYKIIETNGKNRVVVTTDITQGENAVDTPTKLKNFIQNKYDEIKFSMPGVTDGVTYVTGRGAGEYAFSEYTKSLKRKQKWDKYRMADNIDEMIKAQIVSEYEDPVHLRKDDIVAFYRSPIEVQVKNRLYDVELVTGITLQGKEIFYDVVGLDLKNKNEPYPIRANINGNTGRRDSDSFANSISQKETVVNSNNMQKSEKDVKYKLQDVEEQTLAEYIIDIESENNSLKEINQTLREHIKSKEEWSFDPVRINEIVSKIKQEYKARFDTAEIAGRVQEQLERFAKEKDNEEICDDVFRELSKIGTEIAEAHNIADRTQYEEFRDLRTKLRTTKFSLSQEDRSSIPDYGAFRRKYAFQLGITQNAERGADSVYMELSEEYPQFFPDSITHPADQVQKMAEVIELLKPKVLDINTEDAGKAIAAEIIGTMTADDNYRFEQVTIERVKAEYKEKAKELRKEYTSALDEYRKERKDRENMEKLIKLAKKAQSLRTTEDVLAKFPDMIFELDTMGISILEKGFTKKDGTRVLGRTDLEALKKEYLAEMAKDPNYQPDNDYIMAKIGRLDKKQIADLTPELVQELIELTQEAFHKIRTENKLINDAKRREIYNAGIETIDEVRKGSKWKGQNKFKDFDLMHLTPIEFAKTITGYAKNSTFTYLMKELADGERKKSEFKMRSTRFFDVLVKNEDFKKISGEAAEIETMNIAGHSVQITPAIRISLYLHSKNKANMRHITKGGVTFPDIELLRKGKLQEAFRAAPILLTKEDVKRITNGMSSFEIQFAEKVSQWLNGMCKDEINKTSVELLGYEAARVTNYMPIETNKNFTAIDLLNVDKTLEGAGGLKERTGAANPIMLTDIVTVIQRQMDFVGNYSGLAIPVRNFNKVYNVTQKGHTEKGESVSVKQEVENYWGVAGKKYIDNMLADLQGARKTQSNIFSKFRSNYAGAVLTLNVKSFLKQTSGYVQAADTLGFKAIGKGMFEKLPDRSVIERHTPLLWMREQGYSIRELGDYAEGQQNLEKKMPWLMSWLQKADIWTAEFIWRASESYVKDNTELEPESDAYYKEVAKMFNKAIEETQPNYTVMQQADIMRSTSEVMKTLTMFQTQARQNYNIMHSAIGEMRAAKRSRDKDWINEAGKRLGRAVSSQITAAAVAAIMGFVGDLILRREDLWKDDEEKLTAKSVSLKAFEETFTGIISSVFLGQEAYELAASLIHGDKWYGLDTSNTELVNDFITAFINVINTAKGEENKDFRAYVMPVLNLTVKSAKMAGIPAENAKKLVTAMFKTALDGAKKLGISTEWIEYHKMQISTPLSQKSTYGNFLKDVLEKAIIETDEEKKKQFYETAKDMSEDMKKKGIEAEYIDKCVKDVARKAYNEKGLESGVTLGSIPWQKVMKGWDWSLENRFYKNVIDSELETLKDVERIEFSDKGLESLTTMTVSYDGVEYELDKNLARKYETAINDRRVEYYSNVVEKDMDINAVFYGTFKRDKKTTSSTDNRISDYFDYLVSSGEITEQERSSRWAQYKAGNLEVPKVDVYTIEYITHDEMGRTQRAAEIDEMKKELKKKTITKAEYDTWYKDFIGNRIKINKRKYIYGKYSGLDDATKEKVIAKIMDKATSEVQEEMKKEIIAGER